MVQQVDIMAELRTEAIDTAEDRIASLAQAIVAWRKGEVGERDTMSRVKLDAHSLKAVAATFEMKALKALCHRFEDYWFEVKKLDDGVAADAEFFVDRLSETLEAWVGGKEADVAALMRRLPAKGGFDVDQVTVASVEVMLVMEAGTASKIITREFIECGYRMINVPSTIDALQLIPVMKPDAVIINRVMPELSGIDLACAIKAMPSTRHFPVALLASVDQTEDASPELPDDVPVMRKGANFADDVAEVLTKLGIL